MSRRSSRHRGHRPAHSDERAPRPARQRPALLTLLLLLAALTALTWLVGVGVNRYRPASPPLPAPGDFGRGVGQWVYSQDWHALDSLPGLSRHGDAISIERTETGISEAGLLVPLPAQRPPGARLFASGTLSTQAVAQGAKPHHNALFTVWLRDAAGERIKGAFKTLRSMSGNNPALLYQGEMALPPQAASAELSLRLYESSGRATLAAPRVQVVMPWAGYNKVQLAMFGAWCLYGLVVLVALLRRGTLLLGLVPIALVAIIAAGVALPGAVLQQLLEPLQRLAQPLLPAGMWSSFHYFAKIGHAVSFALLALFAWSVRRPLGASVAGVLTFLLLMALATEGIQLFFLNRSTRWLDVGIDLAGALAGSVVFALLWLLMRPLSRR